MSLAHFIPVLRTLNLTCILSASKGGPLHHKGGGGCGCGLC